MRLTASFSRLCLLAAFVLAGVVPCQARNVEYINNYNRRMDKYRRRNGDCDWLELARTPATWQLENERDPSLALDWNRYARQCDLTPIQTSATPIQDPGQRVDSLPKGSGGSCISVEEMYAVSRGAALDKQLSLIHI